MKDQKPVIKAQGLTKQFRIKGNKAFFSGLVDPQWKYKQAVLKASFVVYEGESVAFLGPNGAGKTTTTKMMTGLVMPSMGELEVLGFTPFDRKDEFLKKIGLVMGNKAGLNWDLSAYQSFELLQKIYGISENKFQKRVKELVELLQVGYVLETQVRKLSLGERMKLELIGAILHDPEILFLDEPTIGLDIASKKSVRKFLRHLHKEGKTLILTSHDMDDIAAVCDRAIIINHGQIVYDGTMQELVSQYSDTRYARLEFMQKKPDKDFIDRIATFVEEQGSAVTISAPKDKIMQAATEVSMNYPIADIAIEKVPLEVVIQDIFNQSTVKQKL